MRKFYALLAAVAFFSGVAIAADVKTITGMGKCAKCELKETKTCQNVVEVEDGDKTVKYYLAPNATSKAYHKNVCTAPAKTTVTGEVEEKDGKKVITATEVKKAD